MHAIILAAGENTRLQPSVPPFFKPLMLINGRPLISHALNFATHNLEVEHTTIVVSPENARQIIQVLNSPLVHYVVQPEPIGIIDAITRAFSPEHTRTAILCADNTFDWNKEVYDAPTIDDFPKGDWFGTRRLDDQAARRFTRFYQKQNHVEFLDSRDPSQCGDCWIGPMVLTTSSLEKSINHFNTRRFPPVTTAMPGLIPFLNMATNGGRLTPVEMLCEDLGVPEALK